MTRWLAFRPHQQLTAKALYDLERYVLSRSVVVPGFAHGVTSLDMQTSLCYDGEASTLTVGGVRGITPGGHPISIAKPGDSTEGLVHPSLTHGAEPGSYDIWIEAQTDAPNPANRDAYDWSGKLKLRLATPSASAPELYCNRLFIGTYSFSDSGCNLVRLPICYQLGALVGDDARWAEWTTAIEFAVNQLAVELSNNYRSKANAQHNPSLVGAMILAQQLQASWPRRSWSELWDAVQMMQALLPGSFLATDGASPREWAPEHCVGDQQPQELANSLLPKFANALRVYPLRGCYTETGEQIYVVVDSATNDREIVCRLVPPEVPRGAVLAVVVAAQTSDATVLMDMVQAKYIGPIEDSNGEQQLYQSAYFERWQWDRGVRIVVRGGSHLTYPLIGHSW